MRQNEYLHGHMTGAVAGSPSLAGRAPLGPVVHQYRQIGLQHLFVEIQWIHGDELYLSAGLMY